jgi:hypothetical protein
MFFFSEALKGNLGAQAVKEVTCCLHVSANERKNMYAHSHGSSQHHTQDLASLGLSEAKAELLSAKWQKKCVGLSAAMIAKTLTVNELVDMEWCISVILL